MNIKNTKGLNSWLKSISTNGKPVHGAEAIWEATEGYGRSFQPDVEAGLAKFQERIGAEKKGRIVPMRRNRFLARAASFALLVMAGYAVYNFGFGGQDAQMQTLLTNAEAKEISLADGSMVSVNANTTLTYPEEFLGNERSVELNGEAFFNVEKNAEKPFRVKTSNLVVQVLGTSFNVRDRMDENEMVVFVKTGKVSVTVPSLNERYTLHPGQALVFDKTADEVKLTKDEVANALAWKTKELRFRNTSLADIYDEIERYFGVEFIYEKNTDGACPLTTTIKVDNIESALEILGQTCTMQFEKIASRKYKMIGNCCD